MAAPMCRVLTLVQRLGNSARGPLSEVLHQVDGEVRVVVRDDIWYHISHSLPDFEAARSNIGRPSEKVGSVVHTPLAVLVKYWTQEVILKNSRPSEHTGWFVTQKIWICKNLKFKERLCN